MYKNSCKCQCQIPSLDFTWSGTLKLSVKWRTVRSFWNLFLAIVSAAGGYRVSFLRRCMECRRGLAMRILSVRLSVKRVHCDKTEEKSVQIFTPYETSFSLVFWEEEWLVGATPSTWNFGSKWPRWSEIADFRSIFALSVTPSEKVQLTLIRSLLRSFVWA